MAIDPMQKLLFDVAKQRISAAHSDRPGTVHEIQGNKMRVKIGIKPDGEPLLSPWIHTSDHRGTETQQEVYKVGQNVTVAAGVGGDFRQGNLGPAAPNSTAPQPAHASEGNSTWQQGNTAHTNNDGSNNFMQGDGNDPDVNMRSSKDGGVSGFVKAGGAHNRVHTHKDGVCISWKDDENTIHVDKDGCWCSKPLQIKKPEWKADNKAK
jgi:hypothetical protein